MKTIIALLILAWTTAAYGQHKNRGVADSLEALKMEYETLDFAAIKAHNPLINVHFRNVVTYQDKAGKIRLAYYTTDKNKWISVSMPFSERTNDFNLVNIDGKGQPELIVRGEYRKYGSGGGTGEKQMLILNIDGDPVQIFNVFYGCWEESFGDRENNGAGGYYNKYERAIAVSEKGILISPLEKRKYPESGCDLTEIPAGNYVYENGQIKKK